MIEEKSYELRGIKSFISSEMSMIFRNFRSICESYGMSSLFPAILYDKVALANSFIDEMFVLEKKVGELSSSIVLNPEYTGVTANFYYAGDKKEKSLFYIAPCFRYERPQRNRKRQFWQLGIENFDKGTLPLVLIINIVMKFLRALGLDITLKLNFIGSADVRREFVLQNKNIIENHICCTLCSKRLQEDNIFAILECSVCKIMQHLPNIVELSQYYYDEKLLFISQLKSNNIPFEEDIFLFRGIDYYSNIIFEFHSSEVVLGGGGTYNIDGKMGQGMALGADRIAGALHKSHDERIPLYCFADNAIDVIDYLVSVFPVKVFFYPRKVLNKAIFIHNNDVIFQNDKIQNSISRTEIFDDKIKQIYETTFNI